MRPGMAIALLLLLSARATAQQGEARCAGGVADSLWLAGGPVYRDCEVDTRAKQRNSDPDLDPSILKGTRSNLKCLSVELEFVVDTTGRVELTTVRPRSSESPALEKAIIATLARLRFTAARLADRSVRQLVVYTRSVSTGPFPFTVGRLDNSRSPPPSRPLTLPRC